MKSIVYGVAVTGIIALVVVALAPAAQAQETNQVEPSAPTVTERRDELTQKIEQLKQERRTKLTETRQKACEARAEKINGILEKRSEQARKHLEVFQNIAARVQEFVAAKELTIENYDSLVATITEREAAVLAAIEVNDETTFDCATVDADNPLKLPRATTNAVRDALKEYRTAIKDLIVQVKSNNAHKEEQ